MENKYERMDNLMIMRKRHGLTQEQLARELGVCKMTINRYETGAHSPDRNTLKRIAEILGCEIADIL